MDNAYIKHISYFLPEKVLTNEDIEREFPEWSVSKITDKLGIMQRHISSEVETSKTLGLNAAKKLFKENNIKPSSIDFVLLCTQSPEYFLPTTACLIQNELGIPNRAGALDFNLGCSGFVYGLAVAKGLILAGVAKNILFITSDTYTKYLNKKDKSNRAIFGDAASATLISNKGQIKICDFSIGTDGSGANDLIVKTGCAIKQEDTNQATIDENGYFFSPNNLYMNGANVFNFTLKAVPELIKSMLSKAKLEKSDIDYFLFHQANKFMLNTLRKVCRIDEDKFYIDMKDLGNTVSSTIPIALERMISKKMLKKESKVLLAGFGVGYSWGSCILEME